MLDSCSQFQFTQSNCSADFQDWHRGIKEFGLWCIEITDSIWLEYIAECQAKLRHRLLPNYQRQAHITLCASGLLAEGYFCQQKLVQQKKQLTQAYKIFDIAICGADSFSTAPFLALENHHHLKNLNHLLAAIREDSPPDFYTPHITLGLYADRYPVQDIITELQQLPSPPEQPMTVDTVSFASYQTQDIQGPLTIKDKIALIREL